MICRPDTHFCWVWQRSNRNQANNVQHKNPRFSEVDENTCTGSKYDGCYTGIYLTNFVFVFYLVFKFKAEIPSHWQHAKRLKTMANLSSEPVFRGKNVTQWGSAVLLCCSSSQRIIKSENSYTEAVNWRRGLSCTMFLNQ